MIFYFFPDDVGLGIHIVNRFTFNTINSAFFSVDSFFVLRYSMAENRAK